MLRARRVFGWCTHCIYAFWTSFRNRPKLKVVKTSTGEWVGKCARVLSGVLNGYDERYRTDVMSLSSTAVLCHDKVRTMLPILRLFMLNISNPVSTISEDRDETGDTLSYYFYQEGGRVARGGLASTTISWYIVGIRLWYLRPYELAWVEWKFLAVGGYIYIFWSSFGGFDLLLDDFPWLWTLTASQIRVIAAESVPYRQGIRYVGSRIHAVTPLKRQDWYWIAIHWILAESTWN